jgi:hypothetical protein
MSAKDKDKTDDTTLVISNNRDEGALTLATTVVKVKKDTLIKIRELVMFTGDKTKFFAYKTSVSLAVWANNKRIILNRNMKTVAE